MRLTFTLVLILTCSLAMAKTPASSTQPATQPATRKMGFPTPAELLQKMKEAKAATDSMAQVAEFDINGPISEKPADFSWFGGKDKETLQSLLDRLETARDDDEVDAVLIVLGANAQVSLSQAQEIRSVLDSIVDADKPVFVYADSYDTPTYTLASAADHVCMLEGGQLMMPGVGLEAMFLKGLFDKVGVQADYVQIGEYKGAQEPFTRISATDELKGELNRLSDSLYAQIIDGIADERGIDAKDVKALIDDAMISGKRAVAAGLVDHLIDLDGLRPMMKETLNNDVNLIRDYAEDKDPEIDFSNPFAFLSLLTRKAPVSDSPAVAIIYAAGTIVDGDGGESLMGASSVGSETMRKAFRAALKDDKVKAVVIRIDSPGGSALASEVMWQSARHVAEKKPVIVSIGGMAASGGYYLASAGETIFADPTAIVGSIGVVGGKFVTKDLYEKLGISSETFMRGANADLFSSDQKFTDRQRTMVTNWMKETYDQFTDRVMTTRKGKIKDIDAVARGRIFIAAEAQKLGMVDEIGTVNDAIQFAADKAGIGDDDYDLRVLPAPKTMADYLQGKGADTETPIHPKINIAEDSLLRAIPTALRRGLAQQIQMIELLQERPVLLALPVTITVR